MAKIISKKYKILALILALVLISTSIPLTILGMENMKANSITYENASSEDKRIASEISNETGFSIEEVFSYKIPGRTWNEVLSILKTTSHSSDTGLKSDRDSTLLNYGLDEDFIQHLKKEGFTEQEIIDTKILEERVMLQLLEITSTSGIPEDEVEILKTDTEIKFSDKEDLTSYKDLTEKIDIKKAVYFMLKLKSEFGSYEKVFDEYLYSIQLGIDLHEYISDKESYLKKKDDKKSSLSELKVITLEKIEEKSIEILQKDNFDSTQEVSAPKNDKSADNVVSADKSPLPEVPKVKVEDVKPKSPTDEVMNEIKEINPVKN